MGSRRPGRVRLVIAFVEIGVLAAASFVVAGSIVHLLLRRRATGVIVSIDSGLFLILFIVLVLAGITAKYVDAI